MKLKAFIFILLSLFNLNVFAQPGALDTSFNKPDFDLSRWDGFNQGTFIYATAIQPDEKIIVGGYFNSYNGREYNGIIRLKPNGKIDTTFKCGSGFNNTVNAIAIQSDGKIILGGNFTSYNDTLLNRIVRLNQNGSIDNSFNVGNGCDDKVLGISIQSDNKIIVTGFFTSYNTNSGTTNIARLNVDGSLDNTFIFSISESGYVKKALIQPDGKILLAGKFNKFNGLDKNNIVRVNPDGSTDGTFNIGLGFDGIITCLVLQTDGKILVGGYFTKYNLADSKNIARLNSDGSYDNSFQIGTGFFSFEVYSIIVQSDGKILVGGELYSYNSLTIKHLCRLNSNGIIDNTFNSNVISFGFVYCINVLSNGNVIVGGQSSGSPFYIKGFLCLSPTGNIDYLFNYRNGFYSVVNDIAIQPDKKIIVGISTPSVYKLTAINNIVRLDSVANIDPTFDTGLNGFNGAVLKIVIQPDGKILVGGNFTAYNGNVCNRIARLNSDGSFDATFNTGSAFNAVVTEIVLQNDGKILVGGDFTMFDTFNYKRIIRLNTDGSLDPSFVIGSGFDASVYTIAIQSDGKIVVGGKLVDTSVNSKCVKRLNSDGSPDNSFIPYDFASHGGIVMSIAIQNDGKIIAVGDFLNPYGMRPNRIARFNTDGSFDSSFDAPRLIEKKITKVILQNDGKILLAGVESEKQIFRLNSNGTRDFSFYTPGAYFNSGYTMALQADGNIVYGGYYSLGFEWRSGIVRLLGGESNIFTTAVSTTTLTAQNTFCRGVSFDVSYLTSYSFNPSNIFSVELSDNNGLFTNPLIVGTLTSTTSGTIPCVIPFELSSGNGYRVRVVSSDPVQYGSLSEQNLFIVEPNVEVIAQYSILCKGQKTKLNCSGANNYYISNNVINGVYFYPEETTTYQVIGDSYLCTDTTYITINVDACTGIEDNINSSKILIHPNPSSGIFEINSDEEIDTIYITDLLGKNIFLEQKNNSQIDLSANASGTYFVNIVTKKGSYYYKVLKE